MNIDFMKITFIGYAVDQSSSDQYTGLSVAGNKMQLGIINNIFLQNPDFQCITIAPLASYPKDVVFFREIKIKIADNLVSTAISFLNIPVIKQFSQVISVYRHINKNHTDNTTYITFNAFPQVGVPLVLLSRYKKIKWHIFMADLPIDDAAHRGFLSKILRMFFDKLTVYAIKKSDGLIVLNKNAALKFGPRLPYLSIDGGADEADFNRFCCINKSRKNIVYTGALTVYSGILELLEAIKFIDNSHIVLDIYGSGDLEQEISTRAASLSNVIFHGKKSHKEILEIQSQAFLLVNPRPVDDLIANVTFPSKIFEYMLSSTPILSTRLNCFGDDYNDKIIFIENNKPLTIAKKIDDILMLPESRLREMASNAYLYVVQNKNWKNQCNKILHFMRNN